MILPWLPDDFILRHGMAAFSVKGERLRHCISVNALIVSETATDTYI